MPSSTIDAERLARARQQYRRCLLCERRCGVDRANGEKGFCGATAEARVYRSRVECGEEIELIPSHLLYLSGCNLRCVFCIGEWDTFDPSRGRLLTSEYLAGILPQGHRKGAKNVQWVGGEPTIHLPAILAAMAGCELTQPIVWKSNVYGTTEAFDLLDGVADVYVADFKFGNNACAQRIAGAERYVEIVTRNMLLAGRQARLIVRHLLLPGHMECCFRPIVDWMARNLPAVPLRVMAGYLPRWRANRCEDLASPLGREVGARAVALAREKGLSVIQ